MKESIAVLIFGGVLVLAEVVVMIFQRRSWGPNSVRLTGLSVIVVATVFLAVSAVSSDRLSAAYAVLGVAFGYLVGRTDKKESGQD